MRVDGSQLLQLLLLLLLMLLLLLLILLLLHWTAFRLRPMHLVPSNECV